MAHQRSLDDLGVPLRDVTFCVLDLETTGTSPKTSMITEIGAVKLRGGECLGTYQTMVNPGCAIPPRITVITGITESMVADAPRIESVTPSLLEFIGSSVVVGHNVRFDLSFINATLRAQNRQRLPNRSIDTLALARRLLRPEVPNCKLHTLADRFRLDHQPSHRALDDALATGDLLHLLIERAAAMGATGLDDLTSLPTMAGSPQASKLRLTEGLPRAPGVYMFRGRSGAILYVGKAANLRSRVRSYFSSDQRRMVSQLLRQTSTIDHQVCTNGLEAAVLEIRLIHAHLPRFNKQGTTSNRYRYVKLTLHERFPRLSIVRQPSNDGDLHLGPVSSMKQARLIVEAIHTAVPIRRCSTRIPSRSSSRWPARDGACTAAQLGVTACPCSGTVDETDYSKSVGLLIDGIVKDPNSLLDRLGERMTTLAAEERYEEAADMRDRASALSLALSRRRKFESIRGAGDILFSVDGVRMRIIDGLLVHPSLPPAPRESPSPPTPPHVPPSRSDADEMLCIANWISANAHRVTLESVTGPLAESAEPVRGFSAGHNDAGRRAVSRLQARETSADSLASARPSSMAADA